MIEVRGAREHNLRGIDLDLPHDALIVFTGVSGSGKSSLAFDTLHQEGQRRYLEALSARGGAVDLRRPAVDAITGLPPTIALDQRPPPPDPRATVASAADVLALLGLLFARAGTQHCPVCGDPITPVTHDEIVGALLGLPDGARLLLEAPLRTQGGGRTVLAEIGRAGFSRVRLDDAVYALDDVLPGVADAARTVRVVVDRIRVGPDRRDRLHDAVRTTARAGHGVVVAVVDDTTRIFVDRPYCWRDDLVLPALEPRLFNPRSPLGRCPDCDGTGRDEGGATCSGCAGARLRPEASAVVFAAQTVPGLLGRGVAEVAAWVRGLTPGPATRDLLAALGRRLAVLEDLGLGALALSRGLDALAAGERQRLRLAAQLGAELSGVLYVLDEPAAGLHPEQVDAVLRVIAALRAAGNTVLAVEHHPAVIRAADHVVDFGPGPGRSGGEIVFAGTPDALAAQDTATGRWLSGRARLEGRSWTPRGWVEVDGASARNLVDCSARLPVGAVAALFGPSGSGKTALLDTLRQHAHAALGGAVQDLPPVRAIRGLGVFTRLVTVDEGGGARASRSTPATYVGAWDVVRELLAATTEAQIRGMDTGFFSLNKKGGRCEVCKGTGERQIALGWLPDVTLPCEVCDGRRFAADVLEVRWKGRNAAELLDLPAEEARALLAGHPRLEGTLRALVEVGLGYVPLGQPGHTLSGGEAQRLRLARELARVHRERGDGVLYVLDDPTIGLHPADVADLLALLRRLTEQGATVWLATHDEALAAACDVQIRL